MSPSWFGEKPEDLLLKLFNDTVSVALRKRLETMLLSHPSLSGECLLQDLQGTTSMLKELDVQWDAGKECRSCLLPWCEGRERSKK